VEQITQTLPNGTVCETTVTEDMQTKTQDVKRKCQDARQPSVIVVGPGPALPRKLQASPLFGGQGLPGMPIPLTIIPMEQDPSESLWVLGGVFMEKFVTVFDFDTKKVGFASTVASNALIQKYEVDDRPNPEEHSSMNVERGFDVGKVAPLFALSVLPACGVCLFVRLVSSSYKRQSRFLFAERDDAQSVDAESGE
jgi:hypothetical protein